MKDDLNQIIPENERREIGKLFARGLTLAAQARVNDLRASMCLPPQPVQPPTKDDFRIPVEDREAKDDE